MPINIGLSGCAENGCCGVQVVGVQAPIVNVGTLANPIVWITPATPAAAGSMSAADKTKLDAATDAATPLTLAMRAADGTVSGANAIQPQDFVTLNQLSAVSWSLRVREIDGSPNVSPVTEIQVTNGTLTNVGGGVVQLVTGGGGGGGGGWSLTGDAGTNPAVNFLGTTDNVNLVLRVNNVPAIRFEPRAGTPSIVGGSQFNTVDNSSDGAAVLSGGSGAGANTISALSQKSIIAGGEAHSISNIYCFVGGGENNVVQSEYSAIVGGAQNSIGAGGGIASLIGGGEINGIGAGVEFSVLVGGTQNVVNSSISFLGGGEGNSALGEGCVLGGGVSNVASGTYSALLGGSSNESFGDSSVVCGGFTNRALAVYSSILGGNTNTIEAAALNAVICGGTSIYISSTATDGFIGGGNSNAIYGLLAVVCGGTGNIVSSTAEASFIGGGEVNQITARDSVICGGDSNEVNSSYGFIGGGLLNILPAFATSFYNVIGGGQENSVGSISVSTKNSGILGGFTNTLTGSYSVIMGGWGNSITNSSDAVIAGGRSNAISASSSVVLGGDQNDISGASSVAGGHRAKITHAGCFVFSDYNNFDFNSAAANEFAARVTGGARLITAIDGGGVPTNGLRLNSLGHMRIGSDGAVATSVALQIESTVGAVLLPRLTTAQRNALTAQNGMLIYNTTDNEVQAYKAGAWANL